VGAAQRRLELRLNDLLDTVGPNLDYAFVI
jgi:hypothetical protein